MTMPFVHSSCITRLRFAFVIEGNRTAEGGEGLIFNSNTEHFLEFHKSEKSLKRMVKSKTFSKSRASDSFINIQISFHFEMLFIGKVCL